MSGKLIPNGDSDFAVRGENFARRLAEDPARFEVGQGDADAMVAAMARFRAAFQTCRCSGSRSQAATLAKEQARADAERIWRRLANVIRASETIDAATKCELHIRERSRRLKPLTVPAEPPRLKFVRALHEGSGATPVHELAFYAGDFSPSKPPGAVRLELFVDLIPPGEPIPGHPGANQGGRPWYLRSFTRSPIKLTPPMTRIPMRVVYWGRWADSAGEFGPFSATAVAWIEGGSSEYLPGGTGIALGGRKPIALLPDEPSAAQQDAVYRVLLVEAQCQSLHPQYIAPALPPQEEPKQLEAPGEK